VKNLIAVVASIFFLTNIVDAKTLPEIHELANDVVLSLGDRSGDFCSATVIDKTKNLALTANHCTERARKIVYFVDWTDKVSKKVKYEYYLPLNVTNRKMKENGEIYFTQKCEVTVLGTETAADASILKIEDRCHFTNEAKLSTKSVNYGDVVYTMTNPFMIYNAVSEGKVTQPQAYHEKIPASPVIMFQGQLAPGSSGGALVNEAGELIGITNWGVGSLAFASPVSNVINLLNKLNV